MTKYYLLIIDINCYFLPVLNCLALFQQQGSGRLVSLVLLESTAREVHFGLGDWQEPSCS